MTVRARRCFDEFSSLPSRTHFVVIDGLGVEFQSGLMSCEEADKIVETFNASVVMDGAKRVMATYPGIDPKLAHELAAALDKPVVMPNTAEVVSESEAIRRATLAAHNPEAAIAERRARATWGKSKQEVISELARLYEVESSWDSLIAAKASEEEAPTCKKHQVREDGCADCDEEVAAGINYLPEPRPSETTARPYDSWTREQWESAARGGLSRLEQEYLIDRACAPAESDLYANLLREHDAWANIARRAQDELAELRKVGEEDPPAEPRSETNERWAIDFSWRHGLSETATIELSEYIDEVEAARGAPEDSISALGLSPPVEKALRDVEEEVRSAYTDRIEALEKELAEVQSQRHVADEAAQPLQVIRTDTANILKRLKQLDIKDDLIKKCARAIDRNVERLDGLLRCRLPEGSIMCEVHGYVNSAGRTDIGACRRCVFDGLRKNEALANEMLLRRLCCDLANDSACYSKGLLTAEVVAIRLMGYADEISKQVKYDGPTSLKEYNARRRPQ